MNLEGTALLTVEVEEKKNGKKMTVLACVFIKNRDSLACWELVVLPLKFLIYQSKHATASTGCSVLYTLPFRLLTWEVSKWYKQEC